MTRHGLSPLAKQRLAEYMDTIPVGESFTIYEMVEAVNNRDGRVGLSTHKASAYCRGRHDLERLGDGLWCRYRECEVPYSYRPPNNVARVWDITD